MGKKVVCVVDSHPRFYCEAALWAACVTENSSFQPLVVSIGELPANLRQYLIALGVDIEEARTLLPASPHCNKILPFKIFKGEDIAVFDCDLFVLEDFGFQFDDRVRAPRNLHCNPPAERWSVILEAAGFEPPFEWDVSVFPNSADSSFRETFYRNLCGVITWIPSTHAPLVERWQYWCEWLISNREVLSHWAIHVDQVGMALALHEARTPFEHLPLQTNVIMEAFQVIREASALHLTSGHIPRHPDAFLRPGMLDTSSVHIGLAGKLELFNSTVSRLMPYLERWPETGAFSGNFLNPTWVRG